MSVIIPGTLASPGDLKTIAVSDQPIRVRNSNGQIVTVKAPPAGVQQTDYARNVIRANKRSVTKSIRFTATAAASGTVTVIVGDAFAATQYANANVTWAFQNGASAGANQLAAFLNMIRCQPFQYIGMQIDVSAVAVWTAVTWTEVITDYDSTNTYDFFPKVNDGLNVYAQLGTTRFLRTMGEFNGNWGLYLTGLANNATVTFTFNCVSIQRNW